MTKEEAWEEVKQVATICRQPDWPYTFIVPSAVLEQVSSFFGPEGIKYGYRYIRLSDGYVIRSDAQDKWTLAAQDLWKELEAKEKSS